MKRIFLFVTIAAMFISSSAQNLENFIQKYSETKDAEVIQLDKEQLQAMYTMSLSQLKDSTDTEKLEKVKWAFDHIDELTIISFENCSEADRKSYCDAIGEIEEEELDKLLDINDSGSHLKILGKLDENYVRDLIVLAGEEKEPAFVRVKGKIDLNRLKEMQNFNLVNVNGVTFP